MRSRRSPTSPAALYPKRKFSPTTTTLAPISPTSTSRTNCSGLFLDSSQVERYLHIPHRRRNAARPHAATPGASAASVDPPTPEQPVDAVGRSPQRPSSPSSALPPRPASRPPDGRDAPRRSSRGRRLPRAKHHLGPPLFSFIPVHRQQLIPAHHPVTALDPTPLHAPAVANGLPVRPGNLHPRQMANHLKRLYYAVM